MRSQNWYMTHYDGDVVEYLTDQHEEIRTLMGRVLPTSGPERQRAFDRVRDLFTRHEAAKESVLSQLVQAAPGGEQGTAQRTHEEDRIKQMLAMLESLDVASIPFTVQFREWEEAVLAHAETEHKAVFTLLRQTYDPETLRRARAAVEAAEAGRPLPVDTHGDSSAWLHRARRLFAHLTS